MGVSFILLTVILFRHSPLIERLYQLNLFVMTRKSKYKTKRFDELFHIFSFLLYP